MAREENTHSLTLDEVEGAPPRPVPGSALGSLSSRTWADTKIRLVFCLLIVACTGTIYALREKGVEPNVLEWGSLFVLGVGFLGLTGYGWHRSNVQRTRPLTREERVIALLFPSIGVGAVVVALMFGLAVLPRPVVAGLDGGLLTLFGWSAWMAGLMLYGGWLGKRK